MPGHKSLYGSFGLNSGVILLDLSKLNQVGFYKDYFSGLCQPKYKNYFDDQGLFNIYFHQYPERVLLLDCSWNFRLYMLRCTQNTAVHCKSAASEGVRYLHATTGALFHHSMFTPIYNCMVKIEFSDVSASLTCLQDAQGHLQNKRKQPCSYHTGLLKSLETLMHKNIMSG